MNNTDSELSCTRLKDRVFFLPVSPSEVKNLNAGAGDVGQEDPLEKEMATHFSILAWVMP